MNNAWRFSGITDQRLSPVIQADNVIVQAGAVLQAYISVELTFNMPSSHNMRSRERPSLQEYLSRICNSDRQAACNESSSVAVQVSSFTSMSQQTQQLRLFLCGEHVTSWPKPRHVQGTPWKPAVEQHHGHAVCVIACHCPQHPNNTWTATILTFHFSYTS